jgi:urease accessory protein
MPASMTAATYTLGFALATAILHLIGMGLGLLTAKINLPAVNR